MAVRVRLTLPLTRVTGVKEIDVEEPCRTVREVVRCLLQRFPDLERELMDEAGNIDYAYQVLLNGDNITRLQGLDTPVRRGDELLLVMMLAGGGYRGGG